MFWQHFVGEDCKLSGVLSDFGRKEGVMNQLPSYNLDPSVSEPADLELQVMFLVPLLDRDFETSLFACSCGRLNGRGSGGNCLCGSVNGSGQ